MKDQYGRNIDYMRISITDRCNLRCRYCIPEGVELGTMEELLTFEEIETVVKSAVRMGIVHVKVTGGEPLVRRDVPSLIGKLKRIPGISTVTLTTNGVYLEDNIDELKSNHLDGVNVSLDNMNPSCYEKITGKDCFDQVMRGIESSVARKIPTKINAVLLPEYEKSAWRDLVEYARDHPVDVRFIEMMPIGYGIHYGTVSNKALLEQIRNEYSGLEKDEEKHGNGPAIYYHIPGFQGSIGFISAMHGMFCDQCNRIRMSAQGQIKPCLCYSDCVDLRSILRGKMQNQIEKKLDEALKEAIFRKPKQHCFHEADKVTEQRKMNSIGG